MNKFSIFAVIIVAAFALGVYFARKVRAFLVSKRKAAAAELKAIAQKASEDLKKL